MIKNNPFLDKIQLLLDQVPACDGNHAQLAHALSEAQDRLEAVIAQAEAQFKAGDRHATFNKQFIENLGKV